MKFIIGKKIEMSQLFDEKGNVVPVCLVEAGPCVIADIKTKERDGYSAVQIGFEQKKDDKIGKSEKGKGYKHLREFRASSTPEVELKMKVGDEIKASVFEPGEKIKVSAVSKGKGFQGAVKRWGFHGRNATHGVKHEERTLGSVGATGPARVFLGKKMPGRMGFKRITVKNLEIVKVDEKNNIIAIKGAIPGRRGTLVEIRG